MPGNNEHGDKLLIDPRRVVQKVVKYDLLENPSVPDHVISNPDALYNYVLQQPDLAEVYFKMQEDVWSPDEEFETNLRGFLHETLAWHWFRQVVHETSKGTRMALSKKGTGILMVGLAKERLKVDPSAEQALRVVRSHRKYSPDTFVIDLEESVLVTVGESTTNSLHTLRRRGIYKDYIQDKIESLEETKKEYPEAFDRPFMGIDFIVLKGVPLPEYLFKPSVESPHQAVRVPYTPDQLADYAAHFFNRYRPPYNTGAETLARIHAPSLGRTVAARLGVAYSR